MSQLLQFPCVLLSWEAGADWRELVEGWPRWLRRQEVNTLLLFSLPKFPENVQEVLFIICSLSLSQVLFSKVDVQQPNLRVRQTKETLEIQSVCTAKKEKKMQKKFPLHKHINIYVIMTAS